jgi:hypothetical protein
LATGGITPSALTEAFDPHRVVMRGTQSRTSRCIALHGNVGQQVACTIYAQRPSPCHALVASWENGLPSPQCDRARLAHGLSPLTPAHWPGPVATWPVQEDPSSTQCGSLAEAPGECVMVGQPMPSLRPASASAAPA